MILAQESLEKPASIQRLEEAAAELYKALQAGRDRGMLFLYINSRIILKRYTDMAATMERLSEYQTHNKQFAKRLLDFLSIMFTAQVLTLILSICACADLYPSGQNAPRRLGRSR